MCAQLVDLYINGSWLAFCCHATHRGLNCHMRSTLILSHWTALTWKMLGQGMKTMELYVGRDADGSPVDRVRYAAALPFVTF